MKKLWKKQLPAAALALVMMISLVPFAGAEDTHGASTNWGNNDTQHWHPCKVSGCPDKFEEKPHQVQSSKIISEASCYQAGKTMFTCECGYTWEENVPAATKNHQAASGAPWVSIDTSQHGHKCSTPGCPEYVDRTNHSFSGVYVPGTTTRGKSRRADTHA